MTIEYVKINVSSEHPDGMCNKKIKNNYSTSNRISHLLLQQVHGIFQSNDAKYLCN